MVNEVSSSVEPVSVETGFVLDAEQKSYLSKTSDPLDFVILFKRADLRVCQQILDAAGENLASVFKSDQAIKSFLEKMEGVKQEKLKPLCVMMALKIPSFRAVASELDPASPLFNLRQYQLLMYVKKEVVKATIEESLRRQQENGISSILKKERGGDEHKEQKTVRFDLNLEQSPKPKDSFSLTAWFQAKVKGIKVLLGEERRVEAKAREREVEAWLAVKRKRLNNLLRQERSPEAQSLVAVLIRFEDNMKSWSPYWLGSRLKYYKIVSSAIRILDDKTQSFSRAFDDKDSELFKALQLRRFPTCNFFKGCCEPSPTESESMMERKVALKRRLRGC